MACAAHAVRPHSHRPDRTATGMRAMNKMTLDALALCPLQLEAHYLAIPAGFRHWSPPSWEGIPSEHFTPIEQICHVRDVEVEGYHVRFRRTLHETNPFLPDLGSEA